MKRDVSDIPESFFYLSECIIHLAEKRGISPNEAMTQVITTGLNQLAESSNELDRHRHSLSRKQKAVLAALRRGMAVKEIAHEMNVSEVTVRTHIQRIRNRLGCSDLLTLRMKES